jgi:hypothetical protein
VKDSQRSIEAEEKHRDPIYEIGSQRRAIGISETLGNGERSLCKRVDCRLAANGETGPFVKKEKRERQTG